MAEGKKKNWLARAWGAICRSFRELRSELKKISWPTPKQVAKNTLIVVVCVAVLGVIIFVFDKVANLGLDALLMIKP